MVDKKKHILIRANSSLIFKSGALACHDLNDEQLQTLSMYIGKEIPLVTLWGGAERWTTITADRVLSFYDNALSYCNLNEIRNDIEGVPPDGGDIGQHNLYDCEFLFLRRPAIGIWAPKGDSYYALWHILKYVTPQQKKKA